MTTKDAAPRLGLAPFTVRVKCRAGKIIATKVHGDWDISADAIEAYLRNVRRDGANKPMRELLKRGMAI